MVRNLTFYWPLLNVLGFFSCSSFRAKSKIQPVSCLTHQLSERGELLPLSSCVLLAELIITLRQDRLTGEKANLIHERRGLIEMGTKKWPKLTAFILFDKETFVRK